MLPPPDADGKKRVETFVEEEEDGGEISQDGGHDLFKNRIRLVFFICELGIWQPAKFFPYSNSVRLS